MKQLTLLKHFLLLFALIVGSMSVWAQDVTWEKVDPANLATGDIVVIVDQTTSTAMSHESLNSKGAPNAISVSLSDDKTTVTFSGTGLDWEVTVLGSGDSKSFKFGVTDTENYLYSTADNNGLRVGSESTNVCGIENNGTADFITITDTKSAKRYIGVYSSTDWRSYTSINSNIRDCVTAFYKKVESSSGKTKIATIGELNPTSVNINSSGSFTLPITIAEAMPALVADTDYEITWESTNDNVLLVTDGEYAAGEIAGSVTVTVTVTPLDDETYDEVNKQFTVQVVDPNAPGTENNPYSVQDASDIILAYTSTTATEEFYYVKGIVSKFQGENVMDDGTNYRYYISDDGLDTSTQLLIYKGKKNSTEAFTDANDLQIGDEVVIYGPFQKYNNTAEMSNGNYIVSLTRKEKPTHTATFSVNGTIITTEDFQEDGAIEFPEVDAIAGMTCVGWTNNVIDGIQATADYFNTATMGTDNITYYAVFATKFGDSSSDTYALVPDVNNLEDGDKVILVSTGSYTANKITHNFTVANGGVNGTVLDDVDVTIKNGKVTSTEVAAITLEKSDNKWLFKLGDTYLTHKGNKALTLTQKGTKHAISIAVSGIATIKANDSDSTLVYNPNSGNGRFTYYASTSMKDVSLYKQEGGATFSNFCTSIPTSITVEVKAAGYKAYNTVVATDFSQTENLTAYVVTAADAEKVTFGEVTTVPAGTPVILKAVGGEYTLNAAEGNVTAPATNLLQVSNGAVKGNGDYFALGIIGGEPGFYRVGTDITIPTNYVEIKDVPANAPALSIDFGDETTGIENLAQPSTLDTQTYYDLSGRRVVQPTKGMYIVNGKKVILK